MFLQNVWSVHFVAQKITHSILINKLLNDNNVYPQQMLTMPMFALKSFENNEQHNLETLWTHYTTRIVQIQGFVVVLSEF